jgi:hypothetical protein
VHFHLRSAWAYGKEKIRGGGKKFARLFRIVSEWSKKISGETFQNCCRRGGRRDYEKFLLDSIFPTKLTEFPTKLTEFVPFTFIISQYCPTVKRILPDWLCLPNKLGGGGGGAAAPPPGTPMPISLHQSKVSKLSWRRSRPVPPDFPPLFKVEHVQRLVGEFGWVL